MVTTVPFSSRRCELVLLAGDVVGGGAEKKEKEKEEK